MEGGNRDRNEWVEASRGKVTETEVLVTVWLARQVTARGDKWLIVIRMSDNLEQPVYSASWSSWCKHSQRQQAAWGHSELGCRHSWLSRTRHPRTWWSVKHFPGCLPSEIRNAAALRTPSCCFCTRWIPTLKWEIPIKSYFGYCY